MNKAKKNIPIHDYSKKVDKIIADGGTVDEQLVKMLEMIGGRVIDVSHTKLSKINKLSRISR